MIHLTLQEQRYDKGIEQGGVASVNEQAIAIALGHPPELDGKNLAEGIIHLGYRTQRN